MQELVLDTPALYGDHHVLEVRRILLEMPGIRDVYASSCFRVVKVTYDEGSISPDMIRSKLEAAGYLGELPVISESGIAEAGEGNSGFLFRHSIAYEHMPKEVSFGQKVNFQGRPLWPCPGMGVIQGKDN